MFSTRLLGLSEEMRTKSIENLSIDALLVRPCHTKEIRKSMGGRSKSRDRSKASRDSLKKLC